MPWLERHWYRLTPVSVLLAPFAFVYCCLAVLRRWLYRLGVLRAVRLPVPVIVVGNVTVGGTGKTPLVLWLVRFLQGRGYRPGIVTRGYGGRARTWPQHVTGSADPAEVGDEPVLLARHSGCPVVADPDRARAAGELVRAGCDVVVADDGLQHYRLARDLEIGVIDGERRFGNRLCLPAGPLREGAGRWRQLEVRMAQGMPREGEWGLRLAERGFYRLGTTEVVQADYFRGRPVHAVAGIGHPARFFALLRRLGLELIEHPFPDHHPYRAQELAFGDGLDVIMTEKDAVKCERLGVVRGWYLAVEAVPDPRLGERILQLLEERKRG